MNNHSNKSGFKTYIRNSKGELIEKSYIIDESAESADPELPAFIATPKEKTDIPYYGFKLIDETNTDGFRIGAMTDYLETDSELGCTIGDAFVEAPDGTRAGIVWEFTGALKWTVIEEPSENRWGVYYFESEKPVKSLKDFKSNFVKMLPILKEMHKKYIS